MTKSSLLIKTILNEDKMSNYGMKMLFYKTFNSGVLVETFYTLGELITVTASTNWDLIITKRR